MPKDWNEASRCHTLLDGWQKRRHSDRSVILMELRMSNWNRIGQRGTNAASACMTSYRQALLFRLATHLRSRGFSSEEPLHIFYASWKQGQAAAALLARSFGYALGLPAQTCYP